MTRLVHCIEKAILHMKQLLPSVTSHIAEQGRLSEWMSFFNLMDNDKFHWSGR